jgi:hypothetical protein
MSLTPACPVELTFSMISAWSIDSVQKALYVIPARQHDTLFNSFRNAHDPVQGLHRMHERLARFSSSRSL